MRNTPRLQPFFWFIFTHPSIPPSLHWFPWRTGSIKAPSEKTSVGGSTCAPAPPCSHMVERGHTRPQKKLSSLTNERDANDRLGALGALIMSSCDGVPSPRRAPITQLHSLVSIHEVEVSFLRWSAWRPWLSSPTLPPRRMRSASSEGTSSRWVFRASVRTVMVAPN